MLEPNNNNELPPIPGKRYFTIGEVSALCDVKPHVLRYWEQEFANRPLEASRQPSVLPAPRRHYRASDTRFALRSRFTSARQRLVAMTPKFTQSGILVKQMIANWKICCASLRPERAG